MSLLRSENLIFVLPALLAISYLLLLSVIGGFEADHDVDHDVDHGTGHPPDGPVSAVLDFFLVGKVPISISITSLLLIWGCTGAAANLLWGAPLLSIPVAAVSALLGTRLVARVVIRVFPANESYSIQREDLVGNEAEVTYTLTRQSGEVRLTDALGNQRDLPCRASATSADIPVGNRVLLIMYDAEAEHFIARP